ncbi:hypothetical protein [Microvirga pakistanensis]|uniref:hypothetical protein n=1 Tax=Microvirga pakistanensis TaxID=1682650 RepID=UPI00106935C0|nr:hypothetical protein [Microvirga pakistanensis]
MRSTFTASVMVALVLLATPDASAQEEAEPNPFSDADMPPAVRARCDEVRRLTEGRDTGSTRVDFSVTGPLALVHIDTALTYLGLCGTAPDPKVLCVTYKANGMRVGDVVTVTGGYNRPDDDHVVLDPCLAFPADQPDQ